MSPGIKGFIRKGGRIIPLHAASGAARAGRLGAGLGKAAVVGGSAAAYARAKNRKKSLGERVFPVKVNKTYDRIGLASSVVSGAVGAATFHGGLKSFAAGQVAGHAIDAAGIAANVKSVAGKGRLKSRAEQGAKQEARNFLVGNAVFYGGLLAQKKTRDMLKHTPEAAAKALSYARKILRVG